MHVVEGALVVDGALDVDFAQVAVRRELRVFDFGRARGGRREDQVAFGIAAAGVVEARPVVAQRGGASVVVEADAGTGAQALRDELQILVERDFRLDLGSPLLTVALVVEHVVGVSVVGVGLLLVGSQRTVAVDRREEVRRRVEDEREDIVGRTVGRAAVGVLPREVDAQVGALAHLQVDVASQVVALETEITVIESVGILLEDAVGLVVGHRHEILGILGATAEVQRVALAVHGLSDQFVDPLRIGIEVVVHAVTVFLDALLAETRGQAVVETGLVGQFEVLPRIDELRQALRRGDRLLDAEGDLRFGDRTALGGHQDDAVGTLGTVDGRSGCVLEDAEGFDFVGFDVVDVAGHAVDQHQGFRTALEGADTADPELGVVTSGLGAALDTDQTGELTGEVARQVARCRLHQVAGSDGCDRADHGLAFLLAVTHDDDLFDLVRIGLQLDVDHIAAVDRQGLRQVADVADGDLLFGSDVDDEQTVGIGRGTDVGVLDVNGGSDQRGSVGVGDGTGDTMLFRSRGTLGGRARTLSVRGACIHCQEQQKKQNDTRMLQLAGASESCFIKIFHTVQCVWI